MSHLVAGAYDRTLDAGLLASLPSTGPLRAEISVCGVDELPQRLADLIHGELVDLLDAVASGEQGAIGALALANQLLATLRAPQAAAPNSALLRAALPQPLRILKSIHQDPQPPQLPVTGLMQPWLFTAGRGEPSLLGELRRELGTADRADILVSFITRSGVRKLLDVLQHATAPGVHGQPRLRLRVITTTYTGATDADAVEALAALPGCEVRISLDGSRTRLHAKSWILQRASGSGTAYIGSANLSAAALLGGIEWTVKVSQVGEPTLFNRAQTEFECLWADPEFQPYRAGDQGSRTALVAALARERGGPSEDTGIATILAFDWVPRPFQRLMLERLAHERAQGRQRNLVVAATGTGKTVVAALDYRRACETLGAPPTLLFIAHRQEILQRSLDTFRSVLRALGISDFAGLLTGRHEPQHLDHVFATIDSVLARDLLATPERWHTVIIDECHRMGPETRFDEVAAKLRPARLLGLTATPERADGASIMRHFDARPDGSPAVELRLWDALDQQLVVPFEYYACDDATDFREVPWGAANERASIEQIINLAAESRARQIISAWQAKAGHPARSRAIAFCVSVAHAEYMARSFSEAGIPARCVHGHTPAVERSEAPALLARGAAHGGLAVLTTVDLYNEGIDIPSIDTLLFLRPTQSPVVFQQQLGRGLRHHESAGLRKESCLVLDFVGRHLTGFRFDRLLGPITGLGRQALLQAVNDGFTSLPPGCHLHLEPQTRAQVLAALREALQQNWRKLKVELQAYAATRGQAAVTLAGFIRDQGLEPIDLYPDRRDAGGSGWTALRRACGMPTMPPSPDDADLGRRLGTLLHVDDAQRLALFRRVAESEVDYDTLSESGRRGLRMLAYQMDHAQDGGGRGLLRRLGAAPAIRRELGDLAALLDERHDRLGHPIAGFEHIPLCLHASYERREILAALGRWSDAARPLSNTGVERNVDERWEAFFVTIDKSVGFSGRRAYHDAVLAPDRVQWQSQAQTTVTSPVGRRYLEAPDNGWRFLLFVQERKEEPFRALGQVTRLEHHGSKPITLIWQLAVSMPQELFLRLCATR